MRAKNMPLWDGRVIKVSVFIPANPSRSMSFRDRTLIAAVNETISDSLSLSNPKRSASCAALVAKPRPQNSRRNLHPISVHGVNGAENVGMLSPVNPANLPSTSTAHKPHPRSSIAFRNRSKDASDSAGVSSAGK